MVEIASIQAAFISPLFRPFSLIHRLLPHLFSILGVIGFNANVALESVTGNAYSFSLNPFDVRARSILVIFKFK